MTMSPSLISQRQTATKIQNKKNTNKKQTEFMKKKVVVSYKNIYSSNAQALKNKQTTAANRKVKIDNKHHKENVAQLTTQIVSDKDLGSANSNHARKDEIHSSIIYKSFEKDTSKLIWRSFFKGFLEAWVCDLSFEFVERNKDPENLAMRDYVNEIALAFSAMILFQFVYGRFCNFLDYIE